MTFIPQVEHITLPYVLSDKCVPCIAAKSAVYVRYGSKADIPLIPADVRFTPKSRHWRSEFRCPLCAKRTHAVRQNRGVFEL
jgi:hypothetical protein